MWHDTFSPIRWSVTSGRLALDRSVVCQGVLRYFHTALKERYNRSMAIIDDLAEGRFRLFCSEIRLQRGGAQPFSISGPGSIEINDSGRFEYSIHISADVHHKGFVEEFSRMRPAGTVLRKEDSFSLRGASYDGHIFSGETIDPGTGGALGGPGMVSGTLLELRSVKTVGCRPAVEGILPFGEISYFKICRLGKQASIRQRTSDADEAFLHGESDRGPIQPRTDAARGGSDSSPRLFGSAGMPAIRLGV
jgi:hypothetical protein